MLRVKRSSNQSEKQNISVIVAARNEEKNISQLLDCLIQQQYPRSKFEVIIADDRSQDRTNEIVADYEKKNSFIKLIKITHESPHIVGKKNALNEAINLAKYDILAFTDADCLPSPFWLQEINSHFTKEIDFVTGYAPLLIKPKWYSTLKNLERSSIFALTAGSFGWNWAVTCTARNMAYRKELFKTKNGFQGIGHLRSGDDDLMLQKLAPQKMSFMYSEKSFVPSDDKKNMNEQVNLETRRASKWKYYPISIKMITLLVFIYYLLLGKLTIEAVFKKRWKKWIVLNIVKIGSEFTLLSVFLAKIKQKKLLIAFPVAVFFYIPYFLFFAMKGTFGNYKWKP